MVEPTLKQQDVKLLLKASIDYNSYVLSIVAQVVDISGSKSGANPKLVFRELEKGRKQYLQAMDSIVEKYLDKPQPKIDPNLHSEYP